MLMQFIKQAGSILLLKLNLMLRPSNGLMPYISRIHEKCCLFNKKSIHDFLTKGYRFLHIGSVQVAVKPLTRNSVNDLVNTNSVNDSMLETFT